MLFPPVPVRLSAAVTAVAVLAGLAACAPSDEAGREAEPATTTRTARPESPLPDPDGWGTHVLAVGVALDGAVWVGTYGPAVQAQPVRVWRRLSFI